MNYRLAWLSLFAAAALACDSGADGLSEGSGDESGATESDGDPSDTDAGDTEEPDETDGETDGPVELHPDCEADDPETDASFEIAFEDWPDLDTFFEAEDDCLISSVEITADTWTTSLDCRDATDDRTVTLSIPALAEESPDWAEGEMVHFVAYSYVDGFGGHAGVELTDSDGRELLNVVGGEELDFNFEAIAGSIGAVGSYAECDAPMPGTGDESKGKLALHFEDAGESLAIVSGHRGRFDHDDGSSTVIDVEVATSGHCCHGFHKIEALKRRTVPAR